MTAETTLSNPTRKPTTFDKRIAEIDFIRGILLLFVIFDHFLNCFAMYGPEWVRITQNVFAREFTAFATFYWNNPLREFVREIILVLFCLVSGISCAFSKDNWKRAGLMIAVGFIIAVSTNMVQYFGWFDFHTFIEFNIINVLAFSCLFYCFVQKRSWKIILASLIAWFLFSWYVSDILRVQFPLMTTDSVIPQFNFRNLNAAGLYGDWMPLTPYIIFFFLGAIIAKFVYKERKDVFKKHDWERPICFIGRHTMIVYLVHYPIFQGIFILITELIKRGA